MSTRRTLPTALLSILFGAAATAASGGSVDTDAARTPVSAGGRLAWMFAGDLDLVGNLWVDLPYPLPREGSVYFRLETTTAIRKASGLTFDVRDLGYVAELGARLPLRVGVVLNAFLGQWGKERADASGAPYLRYAGIGVESAGYHGRERLPGVEGRARFGLVAAHREVDATAVFQGDARWSFPRERLGTGLDAEVEGITGRGSSPWDVALGPRLDLFLEGPRRASFFLHYLRSRTPLGLETSGVLAGFEDFEGEGSVGGAPPDVRGSLGVGAGDANEAGRLALQFLSPSFLGGRAWVGGDFDLHVLTSKDTGQLYYVYHVGVETERGGATEGLYLRHRSNHRLAEPGGSVTSINVLEAGIETPAWLRPQAIRRGSRWGALDARARLGVLLDTSFGEKGRLHATGGLRWVVPGPESARLRPYARVEAEDGQVGRRAYALGVFAPRDLDFRLEYLSDDQFYGRDRTALLVTGTVWF